MISPVMLYYFFHKIDHIPVQLRKWQSNTNLFCISKVSFLKYGPGFVAPCAGFLRWSLLLSFIVAFYAQSISAQAAQSWHMTPLLLRISALSLLPILSMLRLQTEPEQIVHMGRCQTFHRIRRAVIDLDLAVILQNHPTWENHMIAEAPANLIVCLRCQQRLPCSCRSPCGDPPDPAA